ncbi:hypothetical protein HMPREF2761_05065, partial [Streptococcus sp. HMSC057E02]|uniref:hypothetical protein n=1 Tax=Streptococcus sp. HMSC057E02 TaxID=1739265 RepID=UPI0008D4BED5
MVPKHGRLFGDNTLCFRAVLFRMVPKQSWIELNWYDSFRAVLFRMVPKPASVIAMAGNSFRAVLFRMVP